MGIKQVYHFNIRKDNIVCIKEETQKLPSKEVKLFCPGPITQSKNKI